MPEATAAPTSDREIVMERLFDAPRALVWQAWTDPAHLPNWLGPRGFTITTEAIDIRVGGSWTYTMHGPDGKDWPNFMRFVELTPIERMVYEHGASPDDPHAFDVTVTLEDVGGLTRMRTRHVFKTAEACAGAKAFGAVELGQQSWDKLGERLRTMGLTITRTFDAPRELVWKAWTEPDRFARWWGPQGFDLEVSSADIREGGVFHYRMSNDQGEMWGKIRFVELKAPSRLVFINAFSDPAGGITRAPFLPDFPAEVVNVVTFVEEGGKTVMTLQGGPIDPSPAERAAYDGMNASMQHGFGATFDQLAAHLAGGR